MYVEKISTRKTERTELQRAMKVATKGDRFVVYKLDRLARSTKELYQLTDEMSARGIDFVSIHNHFDTTTLMVVPYLTCLPSLSTILFSNRPKQVWKLYESVVVLVDAQ
ncbi:MULTISPECIES: recombinase family protein [Lysinibacillus]|uniref:recombinase family protein n=1 Tax=Lysinibacillus TaxID=400634 RepID=UPI0027995665|nr:recombinase family protein [Lysinibacillus boronitolerans]